MVWKGTAQDCVDHMRRVHDIPPLVKVANLARWFPPRTVTRKQWYSMSRPAISGIAVDTLLFSRVGVPLFHRYRGFDRLGTHGAFRGTYMRRMHAFLEESDAASLRRRHRRCAQDIAALMSRTSLRDAEDRTPDVSSRPKVSRQSISRARRPTKLVAVACSLGVTGTVRPHRSEVNTVSVLMDLAPPNCDGVGDRPTKARRPWMVWTYLPASLDSVCPTDLIMSPSPCFNLDALSSDNAEESVGLHDILVTLLCGSENGHTPVNSDQVLSYEDLLAAAGSRDHRQVIRTRDLSPDVQIVDISQVGWDWDSRRSLCAGHPKDSPGKRMQRSAGVQTPATEVRARADTQRSTAAGPSPVVGTVDIPEVGRVETIQLSSPLRSGQLSPASPQTIAF